MSFNENQDKKRDDQRNWFISLLIVGVLFLGGLFISWYLGLFGKVSKSELAKDYGVSVKVLMKWLSLFGSEEVKANYLGKLRKTVKRIDFTNCLGHFRDYRKVGEEFIQTKPLISEAVFLSERTVLRRIREIEFPEKIIGMSVETYLKLKYFPPKQANKIISYLKSKDLDLSKAEQI